MILSSFFLIIVIFFLQKGEWSPIKSDLFLRKSFALVGDVNNECLYAYGGFTEDSEFPSTTVWILFLLFYFRIVFHFKQWVFPFMLNGIKYLIIENVLVNKI